MSPTTSKNNNSAVAAAAAAITTTPETTITETSTATNQRARAMAPATRIMSYQNCIALLALLLCGLATVDGLKCHMCGQYNEGVGSITPCLNYSEQYAHLYLKECSKKSEKYCVVSKLK
ncbi:uncharacterized protein LOC119676443 [Teleopsis dalmanni]|uniref:uncharacterized protein LOC119676443 n=1 Tax=Teleopsis dalmanni TaxID=139649 RepID=UPI0018CE6650|nr:uncharacterized protein LOC119676443 [Teleopsis dalmanni]